MWLVAFGPALGGEIEKTRPAVVPSNDMANARLDRVQLGPLASRIDRVDPAEAMVTMGEFRRTAMADQLTTASERRLLRRVGRIDDADLAAVLRVVRIQLGL